MSTHTESYAGFQCPLFTRCCQISITLSMPRPLLGACFAIGFGNKLRNQVGRINLCSYAVWISAAAEQIHSIATQQLIGPTSKCDVILVTGFTRCARAALSCLAAHMPCCAVLALLVTTVSQHVHQHLSVCRPTTSRSNHPLPTTQCIQCTHPGASVPQT